MHKNLSRGPRNPYSEQSRRKLRENSSAATQFREVPIKHQLLRDRENTAWQKRPILIYLENENKCIALKRKGMHLVVVHGEDAAGSYQSECSNTRGAQCLPCRRAHYFPNSSSANSHCFFFGAKSSIFFWREIFIGDFVLFKQD